MFEDFENRSGFWKDLGSNFTINYSGDAPSFISSGEMWQSMDGSNTQTLAAWENGWVLTNNPDGSMTANPKYTSGLPSETIVRVPVGPTSPNASPTGGVGGVVVTGYGAEFRTNEEDVGPGGEEKPTQTDLEENCDSHECPEGQGVVSSTNEDGSVSCSCFDSGKAVKAIGYGLGAIAVIGLATTGLLVYGAVKITGKIFGK
jgi:hypothetical protein